MRTIKYSHSIELKQRGEGKDQRDYTGQTFLDVITKFKAGDHVYHNKSIRRYKSVVYRRSGNVWRSFLAYIGRIGDWEFCQDLLEYDIIDEFNVTTRYVREKA